MPTKTKEELIVDINETIEDNVSGKVSPADIRDNLINIVDSIQVIVSDENIETDNFSTPDDRNTRAGIDSLQSVHLANYSTADNTAYGFHSLYSTFTGGENTAVGSYSASSNVYGSGNSAFGYAALGNNVRGDNNVSIGKNSLYFNKNGDFNVALGHGAGYYIDDNDSYKLYIAAHNVDQSGMCEYPDGKSEFIPAIYGDLLNAKVGVRTNSLNPEGVFQVDGDITPVNGDRSDSLGTANYGWDSAHVDKIRPETDLTVYGDILPEANLSSNLGSPLLKYENIYAENLIVTGTSSITETVVTYNNFSQFPDKIFYLASSGINENTQGPGAYLNDEGIDGAGFVVQSSGVEYVRAYGFQFASPDLSATMLEEDSVYSRASWNSNISLILDSGKHLQTDRILGRDSLNLLSRIEDRHGLFIGEDLVIGREEDRDDYYTWSASGDINYIGINDNGFIHNTLVRGSGVDIEQNWFTRYDGSESPVGFKQIYIDNQDNNDRLVLSALNTDGVVDSSFVTMRDEGYYGISNLANSDLFIPQAHFNINGSGTTTVRVNALNNPKIQLTTVDNDLTDGVEFEFFRSADRGRFNVYNESTKYQILDITSKGLSINGTDNHQSLVVGKDAEEGRAAISIIETEDEVGFPSTAGYGNIYVRESNGLNRTQNLFFLDDGGNQHDLMASYADAGLEEHLYTDDDGNTLGGKDVIEDRANVSGVRNTALGEGALFHLNSGDDNLAVGYYAGSGIVDGSRNILIGNVVGAEDTNNFFALGHSIDEELPLMYGNLPTGNGLGSLSVNGTFNTNEVVVNNVNDVDSFVIDQSEKETVFNKVELGSDTNPTSDLIFRFTSDNLDQDMLVLHPDNKFLSETNFFEHPSSRSTMEVRADINVHGYVQFADGTKLNTYTETSVVGGTGIEVTQDGYEFGIHLDFDSLDDSSGANDDSLVSISNEGRVEKINLQEFSQLVTSENPQTFFACPIGYNIVLSNETFIDHDQNCENIFVGRNVGRDVDGFTNSIMIGGQAGYGATAINNELTGDIASVFIGYRAGRSSVNSDNSVFIGPSTGQDANGADNSVFIGNSAGQSSASANSIGIGDNALDSVTGSNNIELLGERTVDNTLINGAVSDRINIGGVIAGNSNTGKVSVGGEARIQPNAVMEVRAKNGDSSILQEWFNGAGELVAYLDSNGNMKIKGTLEENAAL